jgi:triacylglycerol lipase
VPDATPAVILLHGLGRSRYAMVRLERALQRAGYRTLNRSYPSTRHSIEHLAREAVGGRIAEVQAWSPVPPRIHFVTHSLGGVLVRWYSTHVGLPEGSRAVMIAPPHGGSEMADRVQALWPVRQWCGPALDELGTNERSVPRGLGPLSGVEAGVIAGTRARHPLTAPFGGPNDGVVSVASVCVEGAADVAEVPHGHTFIASHTDTIQHVLHFLEHGRFGVAEPAGADAPA